MTKQETAKNLRYKKAIVDEFNLEAVLNELEEIQTACDDVRYYFKEDNKTLLNALDGDEDDEFEFRMMLSDLSAECEKLYDLLGNEYVSEYFDDFLCGVSKGSNVKLLGYDSYETDYYKITGFDVALGQQESQKRILRLTKQEIISVGCQCFGIVTAFLSIRTKYDNLKAAFDILRDKHTSFLQTIENIEQAYEKANEAKWDSWNHDVQEFNKLINALPDRTWVE